MKKYIKYIILLVSIFFITTNSYSQNNPGYMGKHILLSADGNFSGSIFIMKKVWYRYGGSAEFILGKKIGIGFSFQQYNSKFPYQDYDDLYGYLVKKNSSTLLSQQYSFDINIYREGRAPIGKFIRFSAIYLTKSSEDFNENLIYDYAHYSPPLRVYNEPAKGSGIGTSIYFGRRRIFKDIFAISWGVKFGLIIPVDGSLINTYAKENYFREVSFRETLYSYIVSFNMSMGFVL